VRCVDLGEKTEKKSPVKKKKNNPWSDTSEEEGDFSASDDDIKPDITAPSRQTSRRSAGNLRGLK
jgi:hypothetical protein